jgi:8-oxo-dGTP pyrophosphatase MutT (NUDIX family)
MALRLPGSISPNQHLCNQYQSFKQPFISPMSYFENIRKLVGNEPILLVRPSLLLFNEDQELLMVKHQEGIWGVPGGMMDLGESPQECLNREVFEELSIYLGPLQLIEVYAGKGLYNELPNGDKFHTLAIVYVARSYTGQIKPDPAEIHDIGFFDPLALPDNTSHFIQAKLPELLPLLK